MRTEVDDLGRVLDALPAGQTLFGWSYGGLIALLATNDRPVDQLIAYEPVIAPFASAALPALQSARRAEDWDRTVEIVNMDISGSPRAYVEALKADHASWNQLRRLSKPLAREIEALSSAPEVDVLGRRSGRVDLIIGECNRGQAPYGVSFDHVVDRIVDPTVHQLDDQGHLAHIHGSIDLANLVNTLAAY